MKCSPIKTIIKNLKNTKIRFGVDRSTIVTLLPNGVPGDCISLIGDVFSRGYDCQSEVELLNAVLDGNVEISYSVDHVFDVEKEQLTPNLVSNKQAARVKYNALFFPTDEKLPEVLEVKQEQSLEPPKQDPVATVTTPVEGTNSDANITDAAAPVIADQNPEPAPAAEDSNDDKGQALDSQPAPAEKPATVGRKINPTTAAGTKPGRRIKVK